MFYLYSTYVPLVVIQHCGIVKNASDCISLPFQCFYNAQVRDRILILEN